MYSLIYMMNHIFDIYIQDADNPLYTLIYIYVQDSDNPDLRDRGFIYWRLLSTDPAAAKDVVLAEKPLIGE